MTALVILQIFRLQIDFWHRLSIENKFCLCEKKISVSVGCCLPPERSWVLSPRIMFSGAWLVQSFLEAVAPCVILPSVQAGNIFPLAKPPLIIMDVVLSKKSRTQTEPGKLVCNQTVPFNRDIVEQKLTLYWNENLHLVSWIENVWLHICGNLKEGNKIHNHLPIWTKEMIVCRFKYF